MSSQVPSSPRPLSLQFGNSETTGGSTSFAGYVNGPVRFISHRDRLKALPRAEGASFNSGELEHERLCLPGTRTNILSLIEEWTVNPQGERIFWLSGMAGTGKSAIARTLAHRLSKKKQLGASFFFSRGRGDRGNASKFFTSIAYQLTLLRTENRVLARSILRAIDRYPDISKRAKRDQWKHLIQEPLLRLESHCANGVVLVLIIDALDECEDDRDVQLILRILYESKGFTRIQFRVFVTGRPRISVLDAFLDTDHKHLKLHDIDDYVVQEDLRAFFGHELKIVQRKRSLTSDFPGEGVIETLVQRAGELFIYAATICLFIAETTHPPPRERLKIVLQNRAFAQSPERYLDQLYLQILWEAAPTTDLAEEKSLFCSHFRIVIGSVVSLVSPLSVKSLAALLLERPDSIKHTLDNLLSILHVSDAAISLIHPSFRDFLLDQERCNDNDFWVDSAKTHLALAKNSLRLMTASLRRDICDLQSPGILIEEINPERVRECIPTELEYACTYWVRHLTSSVQVLGRDLVEEIRRFLEQNALYWLEALSLLGKMQESVLMLSTLLNIVQSGDDRRLVKLVHDAYRFTLNHRSIIEQAPLQTYFSALMFSPSESVLRKVFKSQLLRWITCESRVSEHWDSLLQTLEGNNRRVTALMFSPDGQKLISAFDGATVCIRDATTGTLLHTLQNHDLNEERLMKFSFDGQRIAFIGSMSIKVWDVMFGSLIRTIQGRDRIDITALSPTEPKLASGSIIGIIRVHDIISGVLLHTYEGHSGKIHSLEFSPDGQKLASWCRRDRTILIWDLGSVSLLPSAILGPWQYEPWTDLPLAFSRNGQILACGNYGVEIRDAESGTMLQMLKTGTYVTGLVFLLNEEHIASWDCNGTVQVWDVPTRSLLRTFEGKIKGHSNLSAFSPIGQRLASESEDGNVQVWDTAFNSPVLKKVRGHDYGIELLVFSPNGERLASVCKQSVVCLWSLATGSLRKMFINIHHSGIHISSLLFSVDGAKLVVFCKKGILDIWNTDSGQLLRRNDCSLMDLQTTTANESHGLSLIDRWITVNEKRLIWLPPDRRGLAFATHGTKVAIGSFSGVVTFFDLNLELMESSIALPPNLGRGLKTPSDVYASDKASEDVGQSSNIEDSKKDESALLDSDIEATDFDPWSDSDEDSMD